MKHWKIRIKSVNQCTHAEDYIIYEYIYIYNSKHFKHVLKAYCYNI